MRPYTNVYAVYKGDTFIDLGKIDELSNRLKISKKKIYLMTAPSHHKRVKDGSNMMLAIKIEDDDGDQNEC